MNESLLVPTEVQRIYRAIDILERTGLTKDDIVALIQNRAKGKPAKRDVENILDALLEIEKNVVLSRNKE